MAELRIIKNSGREATLPDGVVEDFKKSLRGRLLRPGDDGYEGARKIWNGMIDRRPALIARCAGAADVARCVDFARAENLVLAVRGGGHGVAGNAVCDGGLMIDLSVMRTVRVDPARRTARADAGVTWGEFDHETQAFGLATPGGQVSTTGIAGLTLGGGWGWLARKYGLASDNLLSVDIVTADGKLRTASDTEHADLFWGVRGGGGNFGVVTSFEYRLHPVGPVVGGFVFYPFAIARDVLQRYRELTRKAPDELAADAALLTLPDGTKVAGIAACYCGTVAEGERLLGPLKTFGTPVVDQLGPTSYISVQTMLDASYPSGLQQYWKSSFLREVDDKAIDTMIAHCTAPASPMCHGLLEFQAGWCRGSRRSSRHRVRGARRPARFPGSGVVRRSGRGQAVCAVGARVLGSHGAVLHRWRVRQLSRKRRGRGGRAGPGGLREREVSTTARPEGAVRSQESLPPEPEHQAARRDAVSITRRGRIAAFDRPAA